MHSFSVMVGGVVSNISTLAKPVALYTTDGLFADRWTVATLCIFESCSVNARYVCVISNEQLCK